LNAARAGRQGFPEILALLAQPGTATVEQAVRSRDGNVATRDGNFVTFSYHLATRDGNIAAFSYRLAAFVN